MRYKVLFGLLVLSLLSTWGFALDGEKIVAGFEKRRSEALDLKKDQPFAEPRFISYLDAPLSRPYATETMGFALELLMQNYRLDEANDAIVELREYYRSHPENNDWEHDSMNWIGNHLVATYELFNAKSTHYPGRLSPEAEAALLELMWSWGHYVSKLENTVLKDGGAWYIEESENHDAQRDMPCLGFSRILKNHPDFRNRTYADGHTPAEHHDAWIAYLKEYLSQRARKGLFVEIASPGYVRHTLKGVYGIADFSEDLELRRLARQLLDLWWATWAEDQIEGVRGGGKTRCYPQWSVGGVKDELWPMAWFYFGIEGSKEVDPHTPLFLTSAYRPPAVVAEIACDLEGRGTYEIYQRRMGLAKKGWFVPPHYRLRTDFGGILRYSYVTPDYLMGSLMLEPRPLWDWALISSQNRHQSVIFRGHPNCRIYPELKSWTGSVAFNSMWSVQKRGAMIFQKLYTSTEGTWMRIRFKSRGLSNRLEEKGWVFVEAPYAYAAVRPLMWSYRWESAGSGDTEEDSFQWMVPEYHMSPVVIQVARKVDYPDYASFREAVLALPVSTAKKGPQGRLPYDGSQYTSLEGDEFLFPHDQSAMPRINGKKIELAPAETFDSPFIQEKWDSGVVTIGRGKNKMTLDFRY